MQQRYYDPIAGRFLSVDPVVTDAQTGKLFGRYTYVDNNPYSKIDPDGRAPGSANPVYCQSGGGCSGDGGGSGNSHENWRQRGKADGDWISTRLEQKFDEHVSEDAMVLFLPLLAVRGALGLPRFLGDYMYAPSPGGTFQLAMSVTGRFGPIRGLGPIYKTTKEAQAAAKALGFKRINETIHGGQAVFQRGRDFITRDLDGHNGGAWKMADSVRNLGSKETRAGTYDVDLNRIGD